MTAPTMLTLTRHGEGDHVVELTLDRPEALNAISEAMAVEITEMTAELAADPQVRAVVVTSSSPKAFCVGADLKERNGFDSIRMNQHRPVSAASYRGILDLPMPTIAVVEGYALGGGFEIALSCDLIVAGEQATVGLPETAVGVIPGGGGTQLLTRRVGWSRAAGVIFTARRVPAPEAYELGMIDQLTPAGGAREAALELAARIAANSPVGVRNAKKAMRQGYDVDLATGLAVEDACWRATAFSADREEGIAAFNEKRSPNWPGR